jgi:hypothetical protein
MASLPPLAEVSNVIDRLPSTVSIEEARVTALIADASSAIRRFTKQDFTRRQTTVGIRPIGNKIKLAQKPVISVQSITVRLPGSVTDALIPGWYWDGPGSDEIWLTDGGSIINLAEELTFALEWQTPICQVTYTHGYDIVPDDIIGVVCSMVTRLITAPGLGGVISENVGEYSYRLSDAAAQGPMALTAAEKDILKDYRPKKSSSSELRMS